MVNAVSAVRPASIISLVSFTCFSCCSNVLSFESLIGLESQASTLITFCQYCFVAVSSYLLLLKSSKLSNAWKLLISPPKVPIYRYLVSTIGFCLASVLGNLVFRFNLSLPIHIIFRSSSTAFTMALGYILYGKRYSMGQIVGSAFMSIGIILVTLSNMADRSSTESHQDFVTFCTGLLILICVTMLTSFLSLYNEQTNRIYGAAIRHDSWKENLFYSHLYALPFFIPFYKSLMVEYRLVDRLPSKSKYWVLLFVNNATQLLCVGGVNRLAVVISAVTLGVILLMRRFISLLLSMVIFHNQMSPLGLLGTLLVFIGAGIYSYTVDKSTATKKKAE